MHGWSGCRDKTTELLDKMSNFSIDNRRCLTNAVLARVSSISINPLASLQVAQAVVNDPGASVPGGNEATTTGNSQLPQTVEESSDACTLDGESKVISLASFVGSRSVLSDIWSLGYKTCVVGKAILVLGFCLH